MCELLHAFTPGAVAINLGPFTVRWYGLFMVLGLVAGYALVRRRWRELKLPIDEFEALIIWLVVAGLIGARLVDVFVYEWWYFRDHLTELPYLWQGGLAWHGSLLGAALLLWWWARRRRHNIWLLLDAAVPGLALGQAIGRWGNYFNQELFGLPTHLPWGIPIEPAFRPAAFMASSYFHPVFLYEFVLLAVLALVLWLVRARVRAGQLFALYLLVAGAVRLVLEFVRVDEQSSLFGLRAGVVVALVSMVAGMVLWWRVHRRSSLSA